MGRQLGARRRATSWTSGWAIAWVRGPRVKAGMILVRASQAIHSQATSAALAISSGARRVVHGRGAGTASGVGVGSGSAGQPEKSRFGRWFPITGRHARRRARSGLRRQRVRLGRRALEVFLDGRGRCVGGLRICDGRPGRINPGCDRAGRGGPIRRGHGWLRR